MYACIGRETDGTAVTCGYVFQVELVDSPFTRVGRWFRELNPWVIDAVLGSGCVFS